MAKKEYIALNEWAATASDEQIFAATKAVKKRRNIWLIIWVVCAAFLAISAIKDSADVMGVVVSAALILGIIAGFINFINNTLSVVKSRGKKANGGIMIFVYCAMGLFIVPVLVTGMCAKDKFMAKRFVGLNKII
ncbi:MAG: hypothetical protein IKI97_10900 [Clostridia bacterium]|nr:hypothetical protein [Clostridia bacterium]